MVQSYVFEVIVSGNGWCV